MLKVNSVMEYTNNSNDELKEIYLRLNWNIFSKNSYARQIQQEKKTYYKDFTKEVEIKNFLLRQGNSVQTRYTLDNTILKVQLPSHLRKGEKLTLEMSIEEEVPKEGMRMGYKDRNFSIAHFHPSICVYDEYGWHTDQYLGLGEFYEEFGEYEVEITLPKSYLVFYTGTLTNPEEVYSNNILDSLNKAKSSNQKVRVIDQTLNPISKDDNQKQTWKIFAKDVRTFAFAAFENYKWDVQNWDGILIHTVYPKELEDYYADEGMKASVHAIKFFSENFGRYIYPQMFVTVGGSGGGMEYPGIIFMGRSFGGGLMTKITSEVVIHEIGHNWYPMMINSNEIDFAFQDEGFNDFITNLAVENFYGRRDNFLNLSGILKSLVYNTDVRTDNQANTINWALNDYEEPITTHSDRYASETAYQINSYPKTASIMFMLQYVMGDSAFADLMMEYYKRFLLKRVYPQDFFNLAMEINYKWNGKRDLRWFFDQCFYKNHKLDYALDKLDYELVDGKYLTAITVERKEQMMMPVDVVVELENGDKKQEWFEVEAFMNGPSKVTKTFSFDSKPVRAEINPDGRLIDVNRLNNSTDFFPPIFFHFNPQFNLFGDPFNYRILWNPTFGFNNVDGIKLGLNFNGSY
ncbi:MAG: M1 family metallopeptidase, partial [Ignavibacteria bacterium]|nr:M1 family metallopeptidase [Ignavibacteria bacterium]